MTPQQQNHRIGAAVIAAIAISVAVTCLTTATESLRGGDQWSFGCQLTRKATVSLVASLASSCPLHAYDTVSAVKSVDAVVPVLNRNDINRLLENRSSVEVKVARGNDTFWVEVPVSSQARADRIGYFLVGGFLSAVVLLACFAAYAASRTFVSLAALGVSACIGVIVVSLLSGLQSSVLDVTSTLAVSFLPATIWHLALLFPTRTELVKRVPGIVPPVYVAAAALGAAALSASYLTTGIRFLAVSERILALALLCGIGTLGWRCIREVNQPRTALHQAQARGLVLSAFALVGIPATLAWASPSFGLNQIEMIAIGIMLTPIPLAYLATRSTLHQVGVRARVLATYGYHSVMTASLCVLAVFASHLALDLPTSLGSLGMLWVLVSVVTLALAPVLWPHQALLSREIAPLGRAVLGSGTEASAGAYLEKSLQQAVRPSGAAAFVQDGASLRPLEGFRRVDFDHKLGRCALDLLDESPSKTHLKITDELIDSPDLRELREAGVAIVVPLSTDRTRSVLLLGAPRGWPTYDSAQIAELLQLCANGTLALEYSWLSEERASSAFRAARGLVAAQVAHDLRNPIETIAMVATREGHHTEARIAREASRTIDVILGRLSSERQSLEAIIKEVVADYIGMLGESRFLLRLTNEIPDVNAPTEVKRVLRNLIDNALAASPPEDAVEIFAAHQDGLAVVEVIDFGVGMTAAQRDRAFDPLYTTKANGTGLGLSSCRAIITGLGGRILLKSAKGEGTRVRLELPPA